MFCFCKLTRLSGIIHILRHHWDGGRGSGFVVKLCLMLNCITIIQYYYKYWIWNTIYVVEDGYVWRCESDILINCYNFSFHHCQGINNITESNQENKNREVFWKCDSITTNWLRRLQGKRKSWNCPKIDYVICEKSLKPARNSKYELNTLIYRGYNYSPLSGLFGWFSNGYWIIWNR